jgi:hypothetical protein
MAATWHDAIVPWTPPAVLVDGLTPQYAECATIVPQLAWQEAEEIEVDDLALNDELVVPDAISCTEWSQWMVVFTCDVGDISVGDAFLVQLGDVWACYGNVILARRENQLVLCRHKPFLQMLNFQVFSDGEYAERNSFWCPPENCCIPLDEEQAFMDILAGSLQFMLAAASTWGTKSQLHNSTADLRHAPIPVWQTACSHANLWACTSAAKMWDMVRNGCLTRKGNSAQLLENACDWQPSLLALHDLEPDEESETIQEGRPCIGIATCPENAFLAIEDGETDEEPAVIEEANCPEEAKVLGQLRLPTEVVIPAKPTTTKVSVRPHRRSSRPDKVQTTSFPRYDMDTGDGRVCRHRDSSLARIYDALDSALPPTRETRMTSSGKILNAKLFSKREATTNRESSLARNYDALDNFHVSSELPPLKGIPTQRLAPLASSRTFSGAYDSCATARSAVALDLNEDITSRPGTRDEDRPLSRHKPVSCGTSTDRSVSTPTLTHSRAFARHRSAITAASTMALGTHAPSVAESFADYTSRVAPATKKMHAVDREGVVSKAAQVLSRPSSAGRLLSAKLPPLLLPEGRLLPEGKGALAGAWKIPATDGHRQHKVDGLGGKRGARMRS